MRTPRGVQTQIKIEELSDKLTNYLRSTFEEWKNVVPIVINEKIVYPLFKVNEDRTIELNFPKEVIISFILVFTVCYLYWIYLKLDAAIKETRYLLLGKYNYKNPPLPIEIEDIPYEAIELYRRENFIWAYKRDIEDIVKW